MNSELCLKTAKRKQQDAAEFRLDASTALQDGRTEWADHFMQCADRADEDYRRWMMLYHGEIAWEQRNEK
jgi:hypothetical protein